MMTTDILEEFMATLKCKVCGGDIIVVKGASVLECEHCGRMQTVPNVSDEKKGRLFDRANMLRRNSEFDKATIIYEDIISEYPEEAEGYFGLVLCKYGIEYVDDTKTGKKVPTCHRTLTTPVEEDSDFCHALEHASALARDTYIAEAREIDRLQKEILSIASREEPYDIFICYKETDEFGIRTEDSTIAQDIYTELIAEGYKVFFSRVTLRGKSGTEYEPYIYSALSSARVMVVIGTCYEYFEAVWVKNEWSRYLAMINAGKDKTLIPCVKGIKGEDLPPRLKSLQALSVSDVTFFKDLMNSIRNATGEKRARVETAPAGSVDPLLKRARIFLADGNFDNADSYCEKVLDMEPENYLAYLYKFMASQKLKTESEIASLKGDLCEHGSFDHAYNYCSGADKERLEGYLISAKKNRERELAENEAARQKWLLEGIDRASEQTSGGEFDKALASVRPALEDNTKDARAYLVALLAKNKCKNVGELACLGVLIKDDEHYLKLLECANEEDRARYGELSSLCVIGCALRFADALIKEKTDEAHLWLNKYTAHFGVDEVSRTAEKLFGYSKDIRTLSAHSLVFGEALRKKARECSPNSVECGDALVTQVISGSARVYRYMQAYMLRQIRIGTYTFDAGGGVYQPVSISELEDEWADPRGKLDGLEDVDISADGEGATPAERYMRLAEHLWKSSGAEATERIDRLTNEAFGICKPDQTAEIERQRTSLYIEMANSDKASREAIEHISDLDPDNAALAWACAERITAGFTKTTSKSYEQDATYDKFINTKKKQLRARELKVKLDSLREELASLDREEADRREAARAMAERAIAKSEDKAEEYSAVWNGYIHDLSVKFAALRKTLTDRITRLDALYRYSYVKGRVSVLSRGIIKSVFTVFFTLCALFVMIGTISDMTDPTAILDMSGVIYAVVGVLIMLISLNIALRILTSLAKGADNRAYALDPYERMYVPDVHRVWGVFSLTKKYRENAIFREPVAIRLINRILPFVMVAASVTAMVLFVYTPFSMKGKLGTVSITTAEELEYIKCHPYLDFKLDSDIDLTDAELELDTVYYFSGSIDGAGHKITGLTREDGELILYNKGRISNIIFERAEISDSVIGTNGGVIVELSVRDSVLGASFVGENKCCIEKLNFSSTKLCPRDDVEEALGFISGTNTSEGSIEDCVVSGCTLIGRNQVVGIAEDDNDIKSQILNKDAMAQVNAAVKDTAAAEGTETETSADTAADTEKEQEQYRQITEADHLSTVDADFIGVICGINEGIIFSAKVTDFTSEAVVADKFGAIAGKSSGRITDVYASGNISFFAYWGKIERANVGGIVGEQSCDISYAVSELDLNVINFFDNKYISVGGIAGALSSGELSRSSYDGNCTVSLSGLDVSTYNVNCVVGGIAGSANASGRSSAYMPYIRDCYSAGKLELTTVKDKEASSNDPVSINRSMYLSGIIAETGGCVIERCYSSLTLAPFVDGSARIASRHYVLGGIVATKNDLSGRVDSSLFAGIMQGEANATYQNMASIEKDKCYYSSDCGFVRTATERAEEIAYEELFTPAFYYDTLGWSEDVWMIEEGNLPVLMAYVPPVDENDGTQATETETDFTPESVDQQ